MDTPKILRSFMLGQFANLFKLAIWWTALAPMTFALLRSTAAIGVGRIVYNAALCVFSPLSGSIVERVHPRTLLLRAAAVRFVIYCMILPAAWVLFGTELVLAGSSTLALYIILNVCLFFDGIAVAWSSILDIDMAGIDITSGVFGLDVTDEMRAYFNTRQEFVFAVCFIIFAPGLAFSGLAIHQGFKDSHNTSITGPEAEAGTLVSIFAGAFLIGTFFQWINFRRMVVPDDVTQSDGDMVKTEEGNVNQGEGKSEGEESEGPPQGTIATVCNEIKEALIVLKANPFILFRLIFLGLEIAFEDAIIVVVAANMGISSTWLGDGNAVHGNIWTSVGVGCGKLGGAVASLLMMKFYQPPQEAKKFIHLFFLIFASTIITIAFPLIEKGFGESMLSANVARGLWLGAFFLYFFLSTLPKLGLMGLLQSMVSEVENGPRVFGFIAILVTIFDGLVIMALSAIFTSLPLVEALWISAGVYLAHGLLELITGPTLVLRPLAAVQAAKEGADDSAGKSESSPLMQSDSPKPDGDGGEGTFTENSASVPIAVPSKTPRGDADSGSVPVAILGTSATGVRVGSVARKSSTLGGPDSPRTGSPRVQASTLGTSGYVRTGSLLTPRTPRSGRRQALE